MKFSQTVIHMGMMLVRSRNKRKNSKMMMPRKCSSCGVTRTPQWREGPVGEVQFVAKHIQ